MTMNRSICPRCHGKAAVDDCVVCRAARNVKECDLCGADLKGEKRNPYTGESLAHDQECPWYGRHDD